MRPVLSSGITKESSITEDGGPPQLAKEKSEAGGTNMSLAGISSLAPLAKTDDKAGALSNISPKPKMSSTKADGITD